MGRATGCNPQLDRVLAVPCGGAGSLTGLGHQQCSIINLGLKLWDGRVRTPPSQLGEAVICALMLCRAAGLAPCPNGSKLGSEAARGLSPGSLVKQSWRLCSANSQSWGLGTLFGWGHRMRSIARQPFGWGPNRSRTADRVPWPERATAQLCG